MSRPAISQERFNLVSADVSAFIKKKLKAMEIEATDLELHNSSSTKTLRVYVTLKRTTNLKALSLAEQILVKEIQQQFLFHPHAFYWRYLPE